MDLKAFIDHLDMDEPIENERFKGNNDSLDLEDLCLKESESTTYPNQGIKNDGIQNKVRKSRYAETSLTQGYLNYSINNISAFSLKQQMILQPHLTVCNQNQFVYSNAFPNNMLNQSIFPHILFPIHYSMMDPKNSCRIHNSNLPQLYMNNHINYYGANFNKISQCGLNPIQIIQPQSIKNSSSAKNTRNDKYPHNKPTRSSIYKQSHHNYCNSENSEETLVIKQSDSETKKLPEDLKDCPAKYTSIEDFIQSCQNPKQYLSSMKTNREIYHLAKQSSQNQLLSLLEMIKPNLYKIMMSNSGNYFCQDFFSLLSEENRIAVWSVIKNKLDYYGTQQFANHAIQKLVDLATAPKEQKEIVGYLSAYFDILSLNFHGTHILQKVVQNYNDASKQELMFFITSNFQTLVFNSCGVCLIKKYIVLLKGRSTKHKSDFLRSITNLIPAMLNDVYAHYSILYIIEEWKSNDYKPIKELIIKDLFALSCLKYSSRLIEKIVSTSDKVSLII